MNTRTVILGAGGFGRELFALLRGSAYEVIGFIDPGPADPEKLPAQVLGGDDALASTFREGAADTAFVAVGDAAARARLFAAAASLGYSLPFFAHRTAFVPEEAEIGAGTVIYPGAVLMPGCRLGRGVLVNSGATLGHDVTARDFATFAPGAHAAGFVRVGEGTLVGIGASVRERVSIGEWSVIGAGAAVIRDIPSNSVAVGVPARVRPV